MMTTWACRSGASASAAGCIAPALTYWLKRRWSMRWHGTASL